MQMLSSVFRTAAWMRPWVCLKLRISLMKSVLSKTAMWAGRLFSPIRRCVPIPCAIKLNVVKSVVAGKRVILVDDSIVRGTTCQRIVNLLREAGATEVQMRISCPPFTNPCHFGVDIDSKGKPDCLSDDHSGDLLLISEQIRWEYPERRRRAVSGNAGNEAAVPDSVRRALPGIIPSKCRRKCPRINLKRR